jgi:hypothetical protein
MSITGGDAQGIRRRNPPENPTDLDPGHAARAARLLRWYPADWRERYGDEFAEVLANSMSDGKGSFRLSFNVAREGVVARLEEAGFIGRLAPPLQRARASVVATLVAVLAFLTSAAVLIRYAKGWQRTPALESLTRAEQAEQGSAAQHTFQRTVTSPAYRQLEQAANRSVNGNSPAWKAFEKAQTQANNVLDKSLASKGYGVTLHDLRPASGAPVAFNEIAQIALLATLICLGTALLVASVAGFRALLRGSEKKLRFPLTLVVGSAALFVLGAIAYEADHKIPPGQPGSEWTVLKWMVLDGNFRFWPVVVLPLCVLGAIALATVGGVQLVRRADMGPRLCRLYGSLAKVTAGCLGLFLVSTLLWATTLSVQAPEFLTAKDQGIFGTPLLPVFLIAIVVMAGACWLVISGSARCVRSVHSV